MIVLKQAIVKENMIGEINLAHLTKDFYQQIKAIRSKDDKTFHEETQLLEMLVNKRIAKIINLASLQPLTDDIDKRLTNEEVIYYLDIQDSIKRFREKIQ